MSHVAALVLRCSKCDYSFSTMHTGLVGDSNVNIVPVELSFKEGSITYACPECTTLNKMEWIDTSNINKFNTLPKMRRL